MKYIVRHKSWAFLSCTRYLKINDNQHTRMFLRSQEGHKLGLVATLNSTMSDFEMAINNSINGTFGEEKVKCCFFYLCKIVYRHIVAEGLQTIYNRKTSRSLKKVAQLLCALALYQLTRLFCISKIYTINYLPNWIRLRTTSNFPYLTQTVSRKII